jgi:tetratricopeptide (TPR) repeat protein
MIKNSRAMKVFFGILVFLIVFSGCTQMKTGGSSRTSIQETTQRPVQETPQQASVQEPVQIKKPQSAGDYQKTIDAYRTEHAKHPHDQSITKDYVRNLDEMQAAADHEYEKENYASACKTYNILNKNYSAFKSFAHMLSFNKTKLNKKLNDCKTVLSKKGFQEYREGNLNEAIVLWQGYLIIDPNNPDIRKAVNTATLQQKNLQKKQ